MLEDGAKIPRLFEQTQQAPLVAAVEASQIGPIPLASPIRQNTKFLDIRELRRLYQEPQLSREVGTHLRELGQREQQLTFLARLRSAATSDGADLDAAEGQFRFTVGSASSQVSDRELRITSDDPAAIGLLQERPSETITVAAPRASITAQPLKLAAGQRMLVIFSFEDATVTIERRDREPVTTRARPFERRALVEMPPDLLDLGEGPEELLRTTALTGPQIDDINARLIRQRNSVYAEIHARVSFAVGCFVLPLVGGVLGMMFRSGNFLTAFALSVVPAMLSIVLIVVGQTIAENMPLKLAAGRWSNPLLLALPLIWAGNAAVAMAAVALLLRLRRA